MISDLSILGLTVFRPSHRVIREPQNWVLILVPNMSLDRHQGRFQFLTPSTQSGQNVLQIFWRPLLSITQLQKNTKSFQNSTEFP